MADELEHEHLFQPSHVRYAEAQAAHTVPQPLLHRPCVLCGAYVELLGPARRRLDAGPAPGR